MYRIKRSEDIALIKKLQKICLPDCSYFLDEECHWWVAWYYDIPVGFYGWAPRDKNTIYICRCGVLEDHRGQGLQKRMARVALIYAKICGYKRAVSDTRDNPASSNSFISSGFKIFTPDDPWAFNSSIYWFKDL